MTMMAFAQLGANAVQLGKSAVQGVQAKKLSKNLGTLNYGIPTAQIESLDMARLAAGSDRFAGQTEAELALDAATAGATSDIMKLSTSGADGLAALTGVDANTKVAQNQLALEANRDKERRRRELAEELSRMAMFQDKEWSVNQERPFMNKLNEISALRYGSAANLYQGVKGAGNVVAGMAGHQANMELVKSMNQPAGSSTSTLPAAAPTPNYEIGPIEPTFSPEDELFMQQYG